MLWRQQDQPDQTKGVTFIMAKPKLAHGCVIENCGVKVAAYLMCDKHYRRWKKTGSPLRAKFFYWQSWQDDGFADYFWSKVDKTPGFGKDGECWEWQYTMEGGGYGTININKRNHKAHRLSWQIANQREVQEGLFVLHSCDNRKCVNPKHLREGTQQDNMDDMVERNRSHVWRTKWDTQESTIREIKRLRQQNVTVMEIAKRLGVGRSLVSHVSCGNTWKHVIL